ncbi:MAG: acetylxylan esterase [Alphaproteobacteria bacterium]
MPEPAQRRFRSKVRKPKDFDDYWNDVRTRLEATPLAPEMAPDPLRSTEDVEVFQSSYASLDDVRIAGWYCRPRGAAAKLPAILTFPGYQSEPAIPKDLVRKGYAALSVAVRGKLRSNGQFNPGYPGLMTHNIVDRHTYGYRGLFADAWRGVDFLLSRPEVDPGRIGVTGQSQAAGLSVVTAAVRPEIKAAAIGAPFLCGFLDAIALTRTTPYDEINDYLRLHPEHRDAVEETLPYFDCLNFAGKVACPIIVNAGLQDNIAPAETAYALIDRLGSTDKRLYAYDGQGHEAGRDGSHRAIVDEFFARHLRGTEGKA